MNISQINTARCSTFLYRTVYTSRAVLLVVVILFITFILQPFNRVQAAVERGEELSATEGATTPIPVGELAQGIPVPSLPVESVGADVVIGSSLATDGVERVPDSEGGELLLLSTDTAVLPASTTVPAPVFTSDTVSVATTVEAFDSSNTISVENQTAGSLSAGVEVSDASHGSSTYSVDEQVLTASSTALDTPRDEEVLPLIHETFSDAEVRFNKRNCVEVDGGAYYCQTDNPTVSARDTLAALPDGDGDLEIFLVADGEYYQLTHNDVDDAAPFYDGRSESMVWHRLIGDSYVIYEFDFESGSESALTDGTYNDMEPSRFGDRTVWQRWVNDHWQIVFRENDTEVQLTTVEAHHVAPVIRGDIILWNTIGSNGEKQIETLDLLTGSYKTIQDTDSAAFTNPRMMMVYEAVYHNGDVVTRGVDLETGQVVSLAATPNEIPDELPNSESTGETRALVSSKPSLKEVDDDVDDTDPLPLIPQSGVSSTDDLTLDLRIHEGISSSTTTAVFAIQTGDLVIQATSSAGDLVE